VLPCAWSVTVIRGLRRGPGRRRARPHTLAKSVHDAGWAQLLRLIGEKAEQYGRAFHKINRFTPSTQNCSACGTNDGPKPLHVRNWQCGACGAVHDRDVNAARMSSPPGGRRG